MSVGDHHNKELADIKQTANPLMRVSRHVGAMLSVMNPSDC